MHTCSKLLLKLRDRETATIKIILSQVTEKPAIIKITLKSHDKDTTIKIILKSRDRETANN